MNIRWDDIDEQWLRVYMEEGKPCKWIFKQLLTRTEPAIRTRWTIIQNRSEQDTRSQVDSDDSTWDCSGRDGLIGMNLCLIVFVV
jgi:hypothetical protein